MHVGDVFRQFFQGRHCCLRYHRVVIRLLLRRPIGGMARRRGSAVLRGVRASHILLVFVVLTSFDQGIRCVDRLYVYIDCTVSATAEDLLVYERWHMCKIQSI